LHWRYSLRQALPRSAEETKDKFAQHLWVTQFSVGATMILNNIEVMFGGQAGDGSLTTGDMIAGVFKRMGLEVYT
jgi:hypothetical protein